MSKKFYAILLSILMVLSVLTPFQSLRAEEVNAHDAKLNSSSESTSLEDIKDKDEVKSFIFVTDDRADVARSFNEAKDDDIYNKANKIAKLGSDFLLNKGFNDAIKGAIDSMDENSEVKAKIERLLNRDGGLLESIKNIFGASSKKESKEVDFKVLFSGFTMSMTTDEALKVKENVPEVKHIFLNHTYTRRQEAPSMYNSAGMVHAPQVWNLGYKGEGRVVAVLDSGADVDHPAMRLTDPSKAVLSKEKVEALIKENLLKGQYLTPKIPYGYNFFDHDMVIRDDSGEQGTGMHGMHVSGIVGANATEEEAKEHNNGIVIKGVAPETQILAMRVFGQYDALTNTSAYIEAIEESIILGADSMNMSLGSMSGSEEGIDKAMNLALENAKKAGSIVAIAAGNDYYTTEGKKNPSAQNPDWGVMGTPGTAESALTVANFNNQFLVSNATVNFVDVDGKAQKVISIPVDTIDSAKDTGFDISKKYELVDCGLGNNDEDFKGKDLKGKVALIIRGDGTFADKIKNAEKHGAIAVLMGNNEADKPDYGIRMQTLMENLIPAYSVTYRSYMMIKDLLASDKPAEEKMIQIDGQKQTLDNPGINQMNESSSWGPNPSLRLKPEISAPGGNIYSTLNTNAKYYGDMTGTSMATPHVAGGIALVNEFMAKNNIDVKGAEKHQFIKNLLMATADPILYKNQKGFYYSPRIQGAGLMNLEKALNPNVVTVVDASDKMSKGKAVVEFGSINSGKLDFSLKLTNKSDKAATYNVRGIAETDDVKDGQITFSPVKMGEAKFNEITVPANGEVTFTGSIDVSGKVDVQKALQPNGFFIDGFIFFESKSNEEGAKEFSDLSVPFLAFYGDWEHLPIIDMLPDQINVVETAGGKKWEGHIPFWYEGKELKDFVTEDTDNCLFSHFYSPWSDGGRVIQGYRILDGEYLDTFAISPNGDGNKDRIGFRGVFLRNVSELRFDYMDKEENVIKSVADPFRSRQLKSSSKHPFADDPLWMWSGETSDGSIVPDGEYKVKITARPQDNKSKVDYVERKIIVDRVQPTLSLVSEKHDDKNVVIKFKAKDELSGISVMDIRSDLKQADSFDYKKISDKEYEVTAKYTLKDGKKFEDVKNSIWLQATDMAGNFVETRLVDINQDGSVKFNLKAKDENTKDIPQVLPKIKHKFIGEDGKEDWENYNRYDKLPYGDYRVYYPDEIPGYYYNINPLEFTLSEENKEQNVDVTFKKYDGDEGTLAVYIENGDEYPGNIKVFAVLLDKQTDENGKEQVKEFWFEIPRKASYAASAFETKVPTGEYRIVVEGNKRDISTEHATQDETYYVGKNEYVEVGTRLLYPGKYISRFGLSAQEGLKLAEIFGDDLKEDRLTNFKNYFVIVDAGTNKEYNFDELKIVNGYHDDSYDEIILEAELPSGNYNLVPKFGYDKYFTNPAVMTIATANNDIDIQNNTGWMAILRASDKRGSLKINTEFVTKSEDSKPNVLYEVYDGRGQIINDITNLIPGEYTLKTWTQGNYRPEKEVYPFNITEDDLNKEITVRWFNLTEESKRRLTMVQFAINGADSTDYDGKIKVHLENISDPNKKYDIEVEPSKINEQLIDSGVYRMTVEMKNGWNYLFYTDIGNGGDKTQGNPDEVVFQNSYNFIEIQLIKSDEPEYNTEYGLKIKETGLEGVDVRPSYLLINKNNNNRNNTFKNEFINLLPGEYILFVNNVPAGFTASPSQLEVTIDEEHKKPEVDINYIKSAAKLTIKEIVVDSEGNEVENPSDKLVVNYEAYTVDKDGKKTYFREGSFPKGVEITIVPVNVKAPYKLHESNKDGIKVTLDDDPKEITFKYVVDNEKVNKDRLENAISDAKKLLKNKDFLDNDYVKSLEDLIKESEDYLKSDNLTQNGVYEAADKLWNLVDKPVLDKSKLEALVEIAKKINKENYTDESVKKLEEALKNAEEILNSESTINALKEAYDKLDDAIKSLEKKPVEPSRPIYPSYPIEPDYPEYPRFDNGGKAQTDLSGNTTTTVKKPEVKPEEEKKEFGIVVPERTLPVNLTDIPEGEIGEAIKNMVARGILKGMDNGKFEGKLPITRAMVAEVLMRLSKDKSMEEVNAPDVKPTDWFNDSIKWAVKHGVLKGYEDGSFKPNQKVTRQEFALIIARFLKAMGIYMDEMLMTNYKDMDTIPSWAKEAVVSMLRSGLIMGETKDYYNGASDFTREELAMTLHKIVTWVENFN